jgi:hypothetical protein
MRRALLLDETEYNRASINEEGSFTWWNWVLQVLFQ